MLTTYIIILLGLLIIPFSFFKRKETYGKILFGVGIIMVVLGICFIYVMVLPLGNE